MGRRIGAIMGRRAATAPPTPLMVGRLDTDLIQEDGDKGERMVLDVRAETIDIWMNSMKFVAVVDRSRFREALHESFTILKIDRLIWAMILPNSVILYPGSATQLVDPKFLLSLRGRI